MDDVITGLNLLLPGLPCHDGLDLGTVSQNESFLELPLPGISLIIKPVTYLPKPHFLTFFGGI